MAMKMIEARGLVRHFKMKGEIVEAVRRIDLDVEKGELVAFLGPNGAGKSTTLRMLTTLMPPTAGHAMVAGCNVLTDPMEVRRRIGYVGQGNGAGHSHRVRDEMVTQGLCYGLSKTESQKRADVLLKSLDLGPLGKRVVQSLSGGQRRRLDVAIGLVHTPDLLFLDEPTTGLDPHNRANLWEHILRLRQESGTTIFMTTHYLDEADTMAERVIVIDHGQIIADDTPTTLKDNLAGDRITISTGDVASARRAAEIAERITSPHEIHLDTMVVDFRVTKGNAILPEFLRVLDENQIKVLTAEVKRPTLDDVFLGLTGRSLRESERVDEGLSTTETRSA